MDLKQGDLENIIMNALWDIEGDIQQDEQQRSNDSTVATKPKHVFVGDVLERINSPSKKWAYTTVKTVLDRLVDKRMANRKKDGKKYRYASILQRDEAAMVALSKVLHQYFQGDVQQLQATLKKLTPDAPTTPTTPETMFERTRSLNQMREIQTLTGELSAAIHR
jgi:predicted transcriptional regulator